jgi:hypothetical protein
MGILLGAKIRHRYGILGNNSKNYINPEVPVIFSLR